MKKVLITSLVCAITMTLHAQQAKDPKVEQFVTNLMNKMTLQEKVGQMAQITLDVIGKGKDRFSSDEPFALDPEKVKKALVDYKIGSVLNAANNRARTPQVWNTIIKQLQQSATKDTRVKIPIVYGIDAIHGETYTAGATIFPQEIGQAATFNRQLVYKAGVITAYETRASDMPWAFSPQLDLGPDPRSPRFQETYGEDPYLAGQMGIQAVKGMEGDQNNVGDPTKVITSVKHFLAYQVAVSGKDRTPVVLSEQAMREYHLPPFKAAIDAGTHTIMVNSTLINGMPVHANYNLLTKLLKQELGFTGFVVSDWADIENLYTRDHIAKDHKEAIMMGINAGIDMSMIVYEYERFCDDLVALVKEGKVKQERIDDAVRRILTVKVQAGLFDKPDTYIKDYPKFGSKEFTDASYQTAAESITLLKNDKNILPLAKGTKILVAGPNANSMRTLDGAWTYSWQGEKVEEFAGQYHTILEALEHKAGKANVSYVPGVSYKMDGEYYEEFSDKTDEAIAAAKNADVIVLCLGENSFSETPGNLNDLTLSDLQTELAQKLAATGKPVILVLNEGRPRVINKFADQTAAIVQAYQPGNFGGDALADILYGDVNPSGKLPYTYPRYPNALINYYHKPAEERATMGGAYNYSADFHPQFQFGDGLSYTTFKYGNLQLSSNQLNADGTLTVSVDVSNTGQREGKEAVLLFGSDLVASLSPDVKRLRGFEKIALKAGETKTVTFKLTAKDLAFVNADNQLVTEPGEFTVSVGGLKATFTYQ